MPVVIISLHDFQSNHMPPGLSDFLSASQWNAIRGAVTQAESSAQSMTCLVEWGICCVFAFPCIFCCHGCLYQSVMDSQMRQEPQKLNTALFAGAHVVGCVGSNISINTDALPRQTNVMVYQQQQQQPNVVYQQPGAVQYAPQAVQGQQVQVQQQYPSAPPPMAVVATAVAMDNSVSYDKVDKSGGDSSPIHVEAQPVNPTYAPQVQQPYQPQQPQYQQQQYQQQPQYQQQQYVQPQYQQPQQQTMSVTLPANAHAGQVLTIAAPNGAMVQVTVQANHRPGENIVVAY